MRCNIVFSGPAHSGKSTLAGYILVHSKSDEELNRLDERIQAELGSRYEASNRFSYYVDTAESERNKSSKSIGTSKFLHMQRINFKTEDADVLLIDSPGSNTKWKSRYQASFMGDVAVIVFELSEFNKLSSKLKEGSGFTAARKKLLWPIYLWKEYKNLNSLIIVISKMDGNNYEQREYHKKDFNRIEYVNALNILNLDSEFNEIPVIPISIDIKSRKEENVYTKSSIMSWYKGEPLMIEMNKKVNQYLSKNISNITETFASVERRLKIRQTQETAFRIKVINGILNKKDTVYITQVSASDKLEFSTGEARIKSMKREEGETTDFFVAGDIGGVTLSQITLNGKSVNASDLKLSRASYLIDKKLDVKTGNLLFLKSTIKNSNFSDIQMFDKINVLMFGKIISTVLVAKAIRNNICYLCVYTKNYPITLPVLPDGTLPFPKYTLEKENMEFMPVKLYEFNKIEDNSVFKLCITVPGGIAERNMIESTFNNCNFIDDNRPDFFIKVSAKNLESTSKQLRNFIKKNKLQECFIHLEKNSADT